ncbi:hypothetical protein ACHAW6_006056 [Cyclotella cf. meneghiniana]
MFRWQWHGPTLFFGLYSSILLNGNRARANTTDLLQTVTKTRAMIITSSPQATLAGEAVLRSGGTAVDAMIAAQTVLGLVRPQDSGLGGGAFVVYYDAATGKTTTFDGRETAPAAATEDRFADMEWVNAWQSGLSVGVPGVPKLMEVMHNKYGKSDWADLFQDAIDLAENGFNFHPSTSMYISKTYETFGFNCSGDDIHFLRDPTSKSYFVSTNCTAKETIIYNKDYAETLRSISSGGADAFYTGEIASSIVDTVTNDLNIPGDMTLEDLRNYRVIERPTVCASYRGRSVCGMGPPSSGGLAVGQILGILDKLNRTKKEEGPLSSHNVHLFTQAQRLAFADRNEYVADSDFVQVPVEGMLNDSYLASRSSMITDTDMGFASPGDPPGSYEAQYPDLRDKEKGTAQISIIDQYGNALSMTTSIEAPFGNSVMVHGFLLNNQLTDFSFDSIDKSSNRTIANRVEPNKRPRSSMSPTIVFDEDGKVTIVTGSAGGSKIIGDVAQTINNMIDFDLDPQEAANIPHYQNRNDMTEIESPESGLFEAGLVQYDTEKLANELKAMGHSVEIIPDWFGKLCSIHVVRNDAVDETVFFGGVDPRTGGSIGGIDKAEMSAGFFVHSGIYSPCLLLLQFVVVCIAFYCL